MLLHMYLLIITFEGVCLYHGVAYGQGEKWEDGCQLLCECIDMHIGRYRCKER
jgi:hypothetical protein